MQKIRKLLKAVSDKTALPTNYYQQHRFNRTSLMPVQKNNFFHTQKIKHRMKEKNST